jgi:hypothetical protein
MGGPSSNQSDDSKGGGTYADQLKASQKKEKLKNLLTPLPIKIIKAVTKQFDSKRNRKSRSGDVYDYNEAKEKIDYKQINTPPDNHKDDNNNEVTKKSIEQPKVVSQMNNTDVKSKLITADKTSPTTIEMAQLTDDERMLKVKRGRKTKTVLTDMDGLNTKPTLSQKALLS